MNMANIEQIKITSDAFLDNGAIPIKYTGFGEDISPSLYLSEVHLEAVTIAIIMDDLDVPFMKNYNHWVIWNIPVLTKIPENIPYGSSVALWEGAMQGVGYGKNRYRGPKPPVFLRGTHRYVFHVYVLDSVIELNADAKKKELLQAIEGHVLQYGNITGLWSNTYQTNLSE